MLEQILDALFINLIIFGSISFILYTFITTRHRERIAIIDRGLDLSLLVNKSDGNRWRRFSILLGCLFIGVSIGVTLGVVLSNIYYDVFHTYKHWGNETYLNNHTEDIIIPMAFLFGGIGMITSTFINKKLDMED